MAPLLALVSALSYGLSDFSGGVASRRIGFGRVALLGQLGGLAATVLAGLLVSRTAPDPADLGWGALSGVGTGIAWAGIAVALPALWLVAGAPPVPIRAPAPGSAMD
ncbi:hypothetical protein [Nocardia abscessus]|uniref:hypothetical protein n=1 Tax=Nocardia abscessus TaxID=120957 RepID=UPI001E4E9EB2|nr:hypothetical protein [Nocardia abscessus]